MTELDIWRTAHLMIERHGDQAELQAAMKADEMLESNDPAGVNAWKNVITIIGELRRIAPGSTDAKH
jgi:hypothetical protein